MRVLTAGARKEAALKASVTNGNSPETLIIFKVTVLLNVRLHLSGTEIKPNNKHQQQKDEWLRDIFTHLFIVGTTHS